MKKVTTLLTVLSVCLVAFSQTPRLETAILLDVNSEWQHIAHVPLPLQSSPQNHEEKIDYHLDNVIEYLMKADVASLSAQQRQNRGKLIETLESYRQLGVYPKNEHIAKCNPVFIDNYNTHCAVGYLMQQSGYESLARKIATNENLASVQEIKTEGVAEWASTCGFSVNELALIQPEYEYYTNYNITPLFGQVLGNVVDVEGDKNNLYVLGNFDSVTYNDFRSTRLENHFLAKWDCKRKVWRYTNFPKLENCTPTKLAISNDTIYVSFSTTKVQPTLYYAKIQDEMEWKNFNYNKSIYDFYVGARTIWLAAGDVVELQKDGAYTTHYGSSVGAQRIWMDGEWSNSGYITGLGLEGVAHFEFSGSEYDEQVFDSSDGIRINSFEWFRDKLWLAANSKNSVFDKTKSLFHIAYNQGEPYLKSIDPTPIFSQEDITNGLKINKLVTLDNKLYAVGKFNKSSTPVNIEGSGIVEITNQGTNYYYSNPVGNFNEVFDVTIGNSLFYFATDSGLYYQYFGDPTGSVDESNLNTFSVYPNPIQPGNILTIEGLNPSKITLRNGLGQEIKSYSSTPQILIPNQLPNGIYYLEVSDLDGTIYFKKVMVE
jgi:hypothetical protein